MKINSNILRAAMIFQAKNDVRYYLNAISITNKHVMASDGCAAVMMEHGQRVRASSVIINFAHKIPAKANTTKIHLLGKSSFAEHFDPLGLALSIGRIEVISAKYPDVKRVINEAYSDYDGEHQKVAIQAKYLSLIDRAFCGKRDFCHISIISRGSTQSVAIEFHNESIKSEFGNPMVCIMPARM